MGDSSGVSNNIPPDDDTSSGQSTQQGLPPQNIPQSQDGSKNTPPCDSTSSGQSTQQGLHPNNIPQSQDVSNNVPPCDGTSSEQSTQQSPNRQNVPPELEAAGNTLKKYCDQRHTNPDIEIFFEDLFATLLGPNTNTGSSSGSQKRKASHGDGYTVKVHTVTTGKTFGADEVLLSRVNCEEFLLERTDQQSCNVIILFCPITSRVDSDVDAAMSEMSGGKPVILVLMHHTWKVDYSSPEKKWSETFENVVLDVDVLYHETERGLLECPKNQEAVNEIRRELLKYSRTVCSSEQSSNQPQDYLCRIS